MRFGQRAKSRGMLAVLAVMILSACSSDGTSFDGPPDSAEVTDTSIPGETGEVGSDPEAVPEDDTDYSEDAGEEIEDFEYPDDPPPADSSAATLCNLNQDYLSGLRDALESEEMFAPVLLGLSDQIGEWESMRPHFPEQADAIDQAGELYQAWDEAFLSQENGDTTRKKKFMRQADELLEELPSSADPGCFE